jgi:hypothetical protein
MSVAHKNYPRIPGILGVSPEVDVQRLTEAQPKELDPTRVQLPQSPKKSSLMGDQTKNVLRRIADAMRQANAAQPLPTRAARLPY